ncbi:MAG: isocitrate lyase/PEP mutase family protein [Armatimonadota bacterium]|nr:isocitrate lyase/PEP mutase family protein [Armatimonadota bacterium]MDR7427038.1 isocitrate lyase/PEP mutase family protein [Armatimonadota bacterium]MDR7464513.1 isocitrate lyase/PEP mutase family protein [Armatimonadota bacterium]MDR7468750.1 isocitrate lyase/PEP mutase family protein [Armatimonadota bacterium]MDR7474806.1 isocitrate lyase/PEP mutase family protein [Armatimonadota bacterium]
MSDASAARVRLRQRLTTGVILVAVGVYDGLSARLAEDAGFEAVYASGGAIARSAGLPDLGLLTLSEMVERVRQITQAVAVPVIADANTGYGSALNVRRTVRLYEDAGVAALHLEDQVTPKRCGHYQGQEVIPAEEMVGKIRAAVEARRDPGLVIIARTDARLAVSLEEALRRARLYAGAGADVLFVEAPRTREEVAAIREAVQVPLLYNLTYSGKSPLLSPEELRAMGYQIVIFPADLQLGAIRGMQQVLASLRRGGLTPGELRVSFQDRDAVVRLAEWLALEERYSSRRDSI